jgi:hypothetical protein
MSKKYGIERGTLRYWMNKYPMNSESLSLPSQTIEDVMARKKSNEPDEIAKLQARIKELEKALAFSELGLKHAT